MKNKYINFIIIGCILALNACNDSFLQLVPEDQITVEAFFKSDGDFRAYSLGLYNFYGYGNSSNIPYNSDETVRGNQMQNSRIYDRRVIPASGGSWSWSNLRTINIMIREAQNANLDDEIKKHWEGVGRLFRAREYFGKVKIYGNVPWVDSELQTDSPELYATQDPREKVMENVLVDLNFAVENIRDNDGDNLINRDVALAIKSEICLFEGTFRKYHDELSLADANEWFRESVSASEMLINSGKYSLSPDYRTIYSSLDLAGNKETILYKHYELGVIVNVQVRELGLPGYYGATKDAVESYLCSDGLPYGISPLHPKAQSGIPELPIEEFKNRDLRMGKALVIPFTESMTPPNDPPIFNTHNTIKPLISPAYMGEEAEGISSPTGYPLYKWWNPESPVDDLNGTLDAPLYAFNTILLNYAEAKAELGEADDDALNKSVNLLRARAGIPDLTVSFANSFQDPKKEEDAPGISNLIWEIRRERRVELMFEGTRLDDIIRWKKASYFGKPFVGAYIDLDNRPSQAYNADGSNKATSVLGDREGNPLPKGARKGYVLPYIERQPSWTDDEIKQYYDPIDIKSLTINSNLVQVPGW